ncbi:hypothetical protein C8A00DRAFT_32752 [Chaetomidium leptoderma]|uniref:Uncharacterized protein n=1 Tax=Chaetomidium leptoderma TaxID=669021 RepID=A0AAN6VQE4_9PEZI|nr:hypothetical protein C8A00DRAFT_32752 [Chaetomidium leptoderma]
MGSIRLDDTLIGHPTWIDAHTRDPKSQPRMNLNRHFVEDRAICFSSSLLAAKPLDYKIRPGEGHCRHPGNHD